MARSKKAAENVSSEKVDSSGFEAADLNTAELLSQAFGHIITSQFGYSIAPQPYTTAFGIKHLDTLLGGGIISSAPVILSSTPETGKSTFAFQFSSIFQKIYPNSIIAYLDIEAAGNSTVLNHGMSRMEIFGLDGNRFKYSPVLVDVFDFFKMIENLVNIKRQFEQELHKEFKVLIVWDSIAATRCSKMDDVEDPNKLIGVKARQVSFCVEKYAPLFAHNRITFMAIDQVRANIKIDGPYVPKQKSVGVWDDFKAASSIASLNHRAAQWLFLSKREAITPDDQMGVNGWFLSIYTEKNKTVPSQESITCVFDKRTGIHKFWSEYVFLSEITRSEKKYFKKEEKLPYPLSIKTSANQVYLEFKDPVTGNIQYKSEKFFKKNAYDLYKTDANFKEAFDCIMDVAVEQRIVQNIFKFNSEIILTSNDDISLDTEGPILQEAVMTEDGSFEFIKLVPEARVEED